MASTNQTVYLISGANRGLGFAFVETLAKRLNTVIYAGVRDPSRSEALHQLSQENPNVVIVKLTAGSAQDTASLVEQITRKEGRIDVCIANAGITIHEAEAKTKDVDHEYIMEHFKVNTLGSLSLYQAVYPLLKKAKRGAKFITISSRLGSNGHMEQYSQDTTAYGISKAAVNFFMRKTHYETEDEGFVVFPMCPNWVQTEMGNGSATKHGMEQAPTTVEDSINGMLAVIDSATRETHGGHFWSEKGEDLMF